ncbi:MAG: hypothetical protein EOP13_14860 [Pseudomonas sp.]|uniref:hypothetical protein n=1 Tax=Pseudomonas sp. TaxID=306 RepID=UPI001215A421|nr:hypothetical protein [Pseudomonas sp.]RZI72510.1 MAG: hypothetical protein EOP13_14860 [Pseudomonas sp.]
MPLPKPCGMDQLVKSLRTVMSEAKPMENIVQTEPNMASGSENAEHADCQTSTLWVFCIQRKNWNTTKCHRLRLRCSMHPWRWFR